jgi:hypothetical protein
MVSSFARRYPSTWDAQVPVVFAGLPKVRTFLTSKHPAILSHLKTLVLYPIEVEDFILEYKDFESEAIEQIYAATKGDMPLMLNLDEKFGPEYCQHHLLYEPEGVLVLIT